MFLASPESFEVKVNTDKNDSDTQIGTKSTMANRKKYFIFSPKIKKTITKSRVKNRHILRATAF